MTTTDRAQLAKLVNRVPDRFVKQIDVGNGRREFYVPHDAVEQLLLYIVGPFDFEVVELIRGDVVEVPPNPQGHSDRAKQGTPALRGVVVGARCQLTATVDGDTCRITEIGDVEDPHNWNNDGKRAKAAASDGLKRCAMRLGLGLHLWAESDYVLDKWLPVTGRDGQAEKSGAETPARAVATSGDAEPGSATPAPDPAPETSGPAVPGKVAAGPDPAPATRKTSRRKTKAAEDPPAEPPAPAATAGAAPAAAPAPPAAAGATSNGHPADRAATMEELAAALGRSLTNCWLRLKRAGQLPPDHKDKLPAQPFAELADAGAVKQLAGDDFDLAKAWLLDHHDQGAAA